MLGGELLNAFKLGVDGLLLAVELGLLLHQFVNQGFVGLVDVAGVGEKAAFLVGVAAFEQQGYGGGLGVFVVVGKQLGNLGFGVADVGLQLG